MAVGPRVLILEDDSLVAFDVAAELSGQGAWQTDVVLSLAKARQAIEDATYDVAVMDISLREGTSFDLARELMARGTRVVFLSGRQPGDVPDAFRHCGFVEKPIDFSKLHDLLADFDLPSRQTSRSS